MLNDRAISVPLLLGEGEGWGGGSKISRLLARVCMPPSQPSPVPIRGQGKESLRIILRVRGVNRPNLACFLIREKPKIR